MELLNNFLNLLSKRESSENVFNPYKNKEILNNLKLYFEYLIQNKNNILIVGEAPGHKGCRITGIPFTSGVSIKNSEHEMFKELKDSLKFEKIIPENTATIVWDFLENKKVPIFWNAFPFHPFKNNNSNSNRKPNQSEIKEGEKYLKAVYEIFKPKKLCTIGRVGEKTLSNLFPDKEIIYIRHPSYGGKKDFLEGMKNLL